MYKCSKLNCWNIRTKEKKTFSMNHFFFRMYLFFQHTCFMGISMNQHFMTKCFECICTPIMHSQDGMYKHLQKHHLTRRRYFSVALLWLLEISSTVNIECTNIATRWACLDIPSQWFSSQSVMIISSHIVGWLITALYYNNVGWVLSRIWEFETSPAKY